MVHSSWSDSQLEEFEYPDEPGPDDDCNDPDTTACPECGEDIYDDSPSCPYCGHYVTFPANRWSGRSTIWIGIGMAGILAVIAALVLGGL